MVHFLRVCEPEPGPAAGSTLAAAGPTFPYRMTHFMLLLVVIPLALSEAVQVEVLRTIALAIAATSSVVTAYLAARNRRDIKRLHRARHVVRDPETEKAVVVDAPEQRVQAPRGRRANDQS